jgi:peptidoglycan/LPS O-acetylase OafA/YrhL
MPTAATMPRSNNFDILRLAFASMVVLFHCYDLSLESTLNWVPHICSARLAVEGFFAMSGCLIVGSYENSSSLRKYLEKRAKRILPGYWLALLFTLVIGVTFSTLSPSVFLRSPDTWKYTSANLGFLNFIHPNLPGPKIQSWTP